MVNISEYYIGWNFMAEIKLGFSNAGHQQIKSNWDMN